HPTLSIAGLILFTKSMDVLLPFGAAAIFSLLSFQRPHTTYGEREMIDNAVVSAEKAFEVYSELSQEGIAAFLEQIGKEVSALGDSLIATAAQETGLTTDRLSGERTRTVNQLLLFADVARKGEWKDVRIDPSLPDRKPMPRPELRRTMIPIGPVAVWAASNFPLAFSVAGGDSASALAAGCPVILKAHPGHPKT